MWSKMLRSEKNESHKRRDFLKKAIKRHEKSTLKNLEQTTRKHLKEHKRGERLFLIAFYA